MPGLRRIPPRARRRAPRGFTMVELVTVLVLLGILAAVAVARLDVSAYRERAFHDGLKAALQYARKAAVAKRRQVCVDATTGSAGSVAFTVVAAVPEDGVAACPAANALPLPGGSGNSVGVPAGVSLTAGSDFHFDALGRARGVAADVTFSSKGQDDIVVVRETGYVR